MNSQFRTQQEHKDTQSIQSFYEPALEILKQLIKRNKDNLRRKGYDENNAAITKEELSQVMARRFRITQWLAQQVVTSLINANLIKSFGGYVKLMEGEQ